ncbi:hypothetical protein [Coprococcus comes]|uniref:hypothetical protein n=1 Tax=Coprococcus comes TaxID=410072 RepID=UPI00319E2EE4
MISLTFGEQVKIVLSRKDMTIKELAEEIEARTGKKMSRQNLTQRLGRDNFQEQDMRMIADILGCPFQLSILGNADSEKEALDEEEMPTGRELEKLTAKKERKAAREEAKKNVERDITVGEIVDILEETTAEPEEEDVQMELELDAAEPVAEEAETQEVYEESEEAEDDADSEDTVATEALEEEVLTEEAEPYTEPEEVLEVAEEVIPEEVSEPVYTEETADIAEVQADDTVYEEQPACTEQPVDAEAAYQEQPADEENQAEADQTEEPAAEEIHEEKHSPFSKLTKLITPKKEKKSSGWPQDFQPIKRREDIDEDLVNGDVNPYTGHEYRTNSVRMHPHRIGYVQVYDRKDHKWTDMTEWAFLGVEERKKATMGKDYEPPIYLD